MKRSNIMNQIAVLAGLLLCTVPMGCAQDDQNSRSDTSESKAAQNQVNTSYAFTSKGTACNSTRDCSAGEICGFAMVDGDDTEKLYCIGIHDRSSVRSQELALGDNDPMATPRHQGILTPGPSVDPFSNKHSQPQAQKCESGWVAQCPAHEHGMLCRLVCNDSENPAGTQGGKSCPGAHWTGLPGIRSLALGPTGNSAAPVQAQWDSNCGQQNNSTQNQCNGSTGGGGSAATPPAASEGQATGENGSLDPKKSCENGGGTWVLRGDGRYGKCETNSATDSKQGGQQAGEKPRLASPICHWTSSGCMDTPRSPRAPCPEGQLCI